MEGLYHMSSTLSSWDKYNAGPVRCCWAQRLLFRLWFLRAIRHSLSSMSNDLVAFWRHGFNVRPEHDSSCSGFFLHPRNTMGVTRRSTLQQKPLSQRLLSLQAREFHSTSRRLQLLSPFRINSRLSALCTTARWMFILIYEKKYVNTSYCKRVLFRHYLEAICCFHIRQLFTSKENTYK
jgi:hypothetical protein